MAKAIKAKVEAEINPWVLGLSRRRPLLPFHRKDAPGFAGRWDGKQNRREQREHHTKRKPADSRIVKSE